MRILIVDDDVADRQILRYYLQQQGAAISEAKNGAEGLRLALTCHPDLIISDALMPDIDGFQFLRKVRNTPELLGTPFIFYSAVYTGDDDMRLALELGADAFITKPKDPVEFWNEVQAALTSGLANRKERRHTLLLEEQRFLQRYCTVVSRRLEETIGELQESASLFQETFEQAAVGMAHLAPDGSFLRCNRRFLDISGYSAETLRQLTLCDLLHPGIRPEQPCLHSLLNAEKTAIVREEKELHRPDGRTLWVHLTLSLAQSVARENYLIAVVQDISEHKELERQRNDALTAAQTARDQYGDLLRSVPDGVIITDGSQVVLMNPAAEKLLGALPNEQTSLSQGIPNRTLAEHIAGCLRQSQPPSPLELVLTAANGSLHTVLALTATATNSQEGGLGTITILRDVTAERASDQLKNEFIAIAAHELRTPLASVVGYAELLQTPGLSPELQSEALTTILDKAEKLEKIISDLLDLSRIESGRLIRLEPTVIDLGATVGNQLKHHRRDNPGYRFTWNSPEEPLPVHADPAKVIQVLDNLLANAVKFSNPGQTIHIQAERNGDKARICVLDEGIGMSLEQRERIFEKFYRADASNTGKPGLGLGLTLSRSIVLAHGGEIWAESTPGNGSRFYFTLPLHPPEDG